MIRNGDVRKRKWAQRELETRKTDDWKYNYQTNGGAINFRG
jgi:hypothetical protein